MENLLSGRPKNVFVQFFRYFWVGGTAAIVDISIFTLLVKYLGFYYITAAFVGYMCGLTCNYLISILWVFESRDKKREILLVFLVAMGGLLWTFLILWVAIDVFLVDEIVGKVIALILVLFWNFGMRKQFVFKYDSLEKGHPAT